MTRVQKIEEIIRSLQTQLEYWTAELETARASEKQDSLIFQEVPERVRNLFKDLFELRRFVNGQHDGKGIPDVTPEAYSEARTPFERLSTIKGIGDDYARETLKVLGIEI